MKTQTVHRCEHCGSTFVRWSGRCPSCGEWNSIVEERGTPRETRVPMRAPAALRSINLDGIATTPTGIEEFDRALSGGLVAGSVTLIGGEPGIGKSTLTLQLAASFVSSGRRALVISAEESEEQVGRRAERLLIDTGEVAVLSTNSLSAAIDAARRYAPELLIVDSIQTISDERETTSAGSVTQVRECASALVEFAKSTRIAVILTGHVTKDGSLAGPRALEHVVDTVCSFEGDRHHAVRLLVVTKHRFGSSGEIGIFEMTGVGLVGVSDPSAFLLSDRHSGITGSVVVPVLEGARPLLVELQALVVPTALGTARRVTQGLGAGRLAVVAAVLERRVGLRLSSSDVFASIVGGVRVNEPATDLGLCLALCSSVSGVALPDELIALGEVGLGGELRQVPHMDRRFGEAQRHGYTRAVVPISAPEPPVGMTVTRVATVAAAINELGVDRDMAVTRE